MNGSEPMTPNARAELAERIEEVVLATAGVRNVYRSGSLISNLLRAGAAALGARRDDEPVVSVAGGEDGIAVEASIGIDLSAGAGAILHSVHGAVDALLRSHGLRRESITLTVVYVQSSGAA